MLQITIRYDTDGENKFLERFVNYDILSVIRERIEIAAINLGQCVKDCNLQVGVQNSSSFSQLETPLIPFELT